MSRKHMATRIKGAREAKGFSQERLAKAIGVTQSAVGQWERQDGTQPNMDNLVRMAEVLETTAEWIAEGKGGPYFGRPPIELPASASHSERIAIALEDIATQVRHIRQILDRIASGHKSD